jgi:hypothetical protein
METVVFAAKTPCRLQWRLYPVVQSAIPGRHDEVGQMSQRHPGPSLALYQSLRHEPCFPKVSPYDTNEKERLMNLELWIPAMIVLGLVTMGLMLAFVIGCEKI